VADAKVVNLDDILEGDALVLTVGEKKYHIKDAPVQFLIAVQQAYQEGRARQPQEIVRDVLVANGATEEDIEKIGTRAVMSASALIMAHFTQLPAAVIERAPGVVKAIEAQAEQMLPMAAETFEPGASTGPSSVPDISVNTVEP